MRRALLIVVLCAPARAAAEPPVTKALPAKEAAGDDTWLTEEPEPAERGAPETPFATKPGYGQFFVTAMLGAGFRFNNPYRLSTPLGDDAESVSRTAHRSARQSLSRESARS